MNRRALAAVIVLWVAVAVVWTFALTATAGGRTGPYAAPAGVGAAAAHLEPTVTVPVATTNPAPATPARSAPATTSTTARPAAPPTTASVPAPDPCMAARAAAPLPLPAGWTESCTASPDWPEQGGAWAVADTYTIHYSPLMAHKLIATGATPAELHTALVYVVVHERCHAQAYPDPGWKDEAAMDRCAERWGADASWSIYRQPRGPRAAPP